MITTLVDNIQETFGLAPIEGMAAGLPLVVTDWDGYRDTCRHGQDGIRIPTVVPPPGAGALVPLAHGALNESFQRYVGNTALMTGFDIPKAAEAFAALAADEGLRRRLGESAQRRASETYDWPIVIEQYRSLWQELAERRAKEPEIAARRETHAHDPRLDDPFRLYGHFATRQMSANTVLSLPPAGDGLTVADIARSTINTGADRFLLRDDEKSAVVRRLAGGPSRVGALLDVVPEVRRAALFRWLGHAVKFDAIRIVDDEPGDLLTE
ncbi:MAG: glycosyltransferase [Alphaproteobacteria bacterium]